MLQVEVKKAVFTPVRVSSDWDSSPVVVLFVFVGREDELVVKLVGMSRLFVGPVGSRIGLEVVVVFCSMLSKLEGRAVQVMRLIRNPAASRHRIFHFLIMVQGIKFQILVRNPG